MEEGDAPGGPEVRLLLKSEAGLFFQLLAYREWKEFVLATVSLHSSIYKKYTKAGFKLPVIILTDPGTVPFRIYYNFKYIRKAR